MTDSPLVATIKQILDISERYDIFALIGEHDDPVSDQFLWLDCMDFMESYLKTINRGNIA